MCAIAYIEFLNKLNFSGKLIEIYNVLNIMRVKTFWPPVKVSWHSFGQILEEQPSTHRKEGSWTVKGWYKALEDLVWLTQLGLNMLLPLVLCLGGCWWAVSHWGWPMWVYLPAVLLGLAAGAQNFWVFVKERLERSKKDKPRRTGFNSHLR